jgi:hypothetical protein
MQSVLFVVPKSRPLIVLIRVDTNNVLYVLTQQDSLDTFYLGPAGSVYGFNFDTRDWIAGNDYFLAQNRILNIGLIDLPMGTNI